MFNVKLPQYIGKKIPLRFDVGKPPNDYKVLAPAAQGKFGGKFTLSFQGFVEGVAYNRENWALRFCIAVNAVADAQFNQAAGK